MFSYHWFFLEPRRLGFALALTLWSGSQKPASVLSFVALEPGIQSPAYLHMDHGFPDLALVARAPELGNLNKIVPVAAVACGLGSLVFQCCLKESATHGSPKPWQPVNRSLLALFFARALALSLGSSVPSTDLAISLRWGVFG